MNHAKPEPLRALCSRCGGRGKVEITGVTAVTYQALLELGGEWSGAALARQMGVKATAMNNRLAALERFGLVKSRRFGKLRLFSANEGASP